MGLVQEKVVADLELYLENSLTFSTQREIIVTSYEDTRISN